MCRGARRFFVSNQNRNRPIACRRMAGICHAVERASHSGSVLWAGGGVVMDALDSFFIPAPPLNPSPVNDAVAIQHACVWRDEPVPTAKDDPIQRTIELAISTSGSVLPKTKRCAVARSLTIFGLNHRWSFL